MSQGANVVVHKQVCDSDLLDREEEFLEPYFDQLQFDTGSVSGYSFHSSFFRSGEPLIGILMPLS